MPRPRASAATGDTRRTALYLTHLAQLGRRPSTIRRARIAIGLEHAVRGAERPDQHVGLRQLEGGIGRTLGSREEGPPLLLDQELAQAAHVLGDGTRDARDRAIILLGFAGAFRAGELVGSNIPDVTFSAGGLQTAPLLLAWTAGDRPGPPGSL